jgi:hypothetical protein
MASGIRCTASAIGYGAIRANLNFHFEVWLELLGRAKGEQREHLCSHRELSNGRS